MPNEHARWVYGRPTPEARDERPDFWESLSPEGTWMSPPQPRPRRATGTLRELGYGSPEAEGENPEALRHNFAVGIELEVEGSPSTTGFPRTFEGVDDNSLRNGGLEARSRRPLRGKRLENSIARLCEWLQGSGYQLSERCSTHIHLDVTDMTPKQVVNLLCLSVMVEPLLFRLFGNTRTANVFCLSTDMGTNNFKDIVESMSNPDRLFNRRWSKYAGIGLNRIGDLGTVEYRMFTPITTKEDHFRVLSLLFSLKAEAMLMETPSTVIDYKMSESISGLFTRYFPEMQYLPEYEPLLEQGVQTLNDIITAYRVLEIVKENTRKYDTIIQEARRARESVQRGI